MHGEAAPLSPWLPASSSETPSSSSPEPAEMGHSTGSVVTQRVTVTPAWPCCTTQRACLDKRIVLVFVLLGFFKFIFQLKQPPLPFASGLSGALETFLHLTLRVITVSDISPRCTQQHHLLVFEAALTRQEGGGGTGIIQALWEPYIMLHFFFLYTLR